MDFQRLLLFVALSFVLMMMYQAWQEDYGPKPAPVPVTQSAETQSPDLPPEMAMSAAPGAADTPDTGTGLVSGQRVKVVTDEFVIEIDTVGGDLRKLSLPKYPLVLNEPENPFPLLNDEGSLLFVAQSGLRQASGVQTKTPDHHAIYQASQSEYRMAAGQDSLTVPLVWEQEGLKVTKSYTFYRGRYDIEVSFDIENNSGQPWAGHLYRQLQRNRPAEASSSFGIYTYTGGVIYSDEEKYEKYDFDDMDENNLKREISGGWAAMIQHYFAGAWVPPADEKAIYYSKALDNSRYLLGMMGGAQRVENGGKVQLTSKMYMGPKLQHQMEALAPGLELTVDYGFLTIIAKPIFWLMEKIHGMVNNWGWSIIILTILIKLAFYKLSETSYRSMAHMRKVQPRMQSLKERYADDKQGFQQAMMKMYREEKINPLGGCLPILVQIPVFIALYWVLLESVEMRQAPFILWINDLSTKDPYFVLPILMGASMLIQHRLNPTPLDPIQAKVMMILPIVFTVFFAFFPAGLVLYWVVNNILSITQQWYITKHVVKA